MASLSPAESDAEAERIRQQARIQTLLARREVKKITVNVDVIEPITLTEVRRAIDGTPRKNPLNGQITVTRGVVIDPKAPEGAVVFLVVLDDAERELFYSLLGDRFPGEVSAEAEAPTAEVVQLAELGQVRVFDGPSVPHLSPPPSDIRERGEIAKRSGAPEPPVQVVDPRGLTLPDELIVRKNLASRPSGPGNRRRSRSVGDPVAIEPEVPGTVIGDRPPESPLVLVWVVPRKSGRGG